MPRSARTPRLLAAVATIFGIFLGHFGLEARALTEKAPDERAIEIVLRVAVDYSTGAIAELQSVSALLESGKSRRMPV